MPWKERSIVEERMRFVLRLKDGESMSSLCREFGISRVTGYKIYDRYKECGLEGLTDRARTPYRKMAWMVLQAGARTSLGNFRNSRSLSLRVVTRQRRSRTKAE